MSIIKQAIIPEHIRQALKQSGIKIKKYRSPVSVERDLTRFIKRNEVLHLSTYQKNVVRSTPVGYRSKGLTFYILSEGGGKFANLKENKRVAFSIAEPYSVDDDFWGYKGLQAWGKARVYSRIKNPDLFKEAFKAMGLRVGAKKLKLKDLSPYFNHKIIEIVPVRIKYTNPREGVYRITWEAS